MGRDGVGPNGIAWHPSGFLLVARHETGSLLRVPVHDPGGIRPVALDEPAATSSTPFAGQGRGA
ncbi:hypothetical protein [Streptomyces radicis]|uniref:Uncharacterized protein n=1 Tax=Streptomyces radicis TaxID=1750517 RepID=A0A3A9WBB6_9ACTN|nr:hypothetical protein [Streptomyces radicis]RKN10611.1 hypothetical protein D7319_09330 [Streptomyces radicis]RKN24872.1 hypothetical protein D7318_10510 [Streptomyces radicis]